MCRSGRSNRSKHADPRRSAAVATEELPRHPMLWCGRSHPVGPEHRARTTVSAIQTSAQHCTYAYALPTGPPAMSSPEFVPRHP